MSHASALTDDHSESPANARSQKVAHSASFAADSPLMIVSGLIALCAWFVIFGLGLFINSAEYRTQVAQSVDATNLVMSILTYTPTNVGLVCLVAAFIGGCTSRLHAEHTEQVARARGPRPRDSTEAPEASVEVGDAPSPSDSDVYRTENPATSLLRGFVVYGAYMAGSAIATDNPFGSTTPEQYARAAGAVSLAAFTIGFDPTFLYSLIRLKGKSAKAAP